MAETLLFLRQLISRARTVRDHAIQFEWRSDAATRAIAWAGAAARACDAVLRLLDAAEPNSAAYNLLCRYLAMLDERGGDRAGLAEALAFRLKLALVAGFALVMAPVASLALATLALVRAKVR